MTENELVIADGVLLPLGSLNEHDLCWLWQLNEWSRNIMAVALTQAIYHITGCLDSGLL